MSVAAPLAFLLTFPHILFFFSSSSFPLTLRLLLSLSPPQPCFLYSPSSSWPPRLSSLPSLPLCHLSPNPSLAQLTFLSSCYCDGFHRTLASRSLSPCLDHHDHPFLLFPAHLDHVGRLCLCHLCPCPIVLPFLRLDDH